MIGSVILLVATGLLLILLSLPMIRRRVKPNALYGLRIAATFADEWVWYEANARSGWDLLILGTVQVVLAVILPLFRGLSLDAYLLTNAGVMLVGTVVCCIIGSRRANRLLKESRQALPRT